MISTATDRIEKHVLLPAPARRVHAARRAEAFRMNEAGWAEQAQRIDRHVSS